MSRGHKSCRFCSEKGGAIDYKEPHQLRYFITEGGKIVPRRITGNCFQHQKMLTSAIKRARVVALVP